VRVPSFPCEVCLILVDDLRGAARGGDGDSFDAKAYARAEVQLNAHFDTHPYTRDDISRLSAFVDCAVERLQQREHADD
jgi:hypothetical protein